MTEAVCSGREFDRHERIVAPLENRQIRFQFPDRLVLSKIREDVFDNFLPANRLEEIVDHDPLIVPAYALLDSVE